MNHLDPAWLQTFVAIVDTGAIARAAQQVHRSPSAVSMQLRQLESALGTSLLERSTRSLHLLPAGERLLPHARALLALQAQVRGAVQAVDAEAPPLRLGFSEYFMPHRLPALMTMLEQHAEGRRLELLWAPSPFLMTLWEGGEADLAVVATDAPPPAGRLLRRETLSWVAAPGWTVPDPVPLILLGPGCPVRARALEALSRRRMPHQLRVTCSGGQAAAAAVRAGWGVGCLNASAVPPDLQVLRRGWPAAGRVSFWGVANAGAQPVLRALQAWAR